MSVQLYNVSPWQCVPHAVGVIVGGLSAGRFSRYGFVVRQSDFILFIFIFTVLFKSGPVTMEGQFVLNLTVYLLI